MRIWSFPASIAVSIGIVSACFSAHCINAVAQQPQVNAGQATVEASSGKSNCEPLTLKLP